ARFDPSSPGEAVAAALAEAAIAAEFAPAAAQLLAATLQTPLAVDGLRLNQLAPGSQIRELEFLFPIGVPDMPALAAAIGPGQGADGRLAERVARLTPQRAEGFLKGFIDLVFEHDGRLHLLDYKSNWLGPRFADYAEAQLAAAMAAENYDLQALLYAVALHRLQGWRRPDYDYERHGGSAWYLFLRGMGPEHPGSGVFHWRPSRQLVEQVDACLARQAGLLT
ncbi:MAG TPA: PD-(D/E)XK nuclease family protein, partial [Rhodocyclaceae bacterium]